MTIQQKAFLLCLFALGPIAVTAQTTTPPTAKTLTPAEQKRQEKLQKEIEAQRKFKAEMAERQRQYYAEQAEKERKKREREAGRDPKKQTDPAPTVTTEAPRSAPPNPQPANPASTPPTATPSTNAPSATDRERDDRRAAEAARKEQADREKAARQAQAERDREADRQQKEATRRQAELDRQQAQQQREADRQRDRQIKDQQRQRQALPAEAVAGPDTIGAFGPRKQFLPKDHLFAPILLDPIQSQTYGSVLPVYVSNGRRYKGTIVPFAFGVQKPFFRRQTGTNRASEWALDIASFTQFEVYQDEKIKKQRRQLINTDYRVGISYHLRRGAGTWRFRAYHLSSHLGDDYIIRNQLNYRLPNAVNYELIDATYSKQVRDFRVYGGVGLGLRVSDERKPLSAQAGFWYKKPTTRVAQLVGGIDLKLWQQTDFRPGIKAGAGITAGRGLNNLTFLLETYSGFRPYSLYETDKVFWLGFGVYLQPF